MYIQFSNTGDMGLISYGSTGLKDPQLRYSTYDLELSAVFFAFRKLSDYMSGGAHFTVLSDHKPLEGLQH